MSDEFTSEIISSLTSTSLASTLLISPIKEEFLALNIFCLLSKSSI